ncbi:MAG: primosomal protein N' [Deltaproteobacteria bacterium]|nr:MAG: primosomal protein N' [Deltaproteobacteria bacterium]
MSSFVQVCIPLPVEGLFTYSVPEGLPILPAEGMRVFVPFGKRQMTGVVFAVSDRTEVEKTLPIIDVLDAEPLFSKEDLEFVIEAARFYGVSPGEMLQVMTPPGFFREEKVRYQITEEGLSRFEKASGREKEALALFTLAKGISSLQAVRGLRKIGYRAPHSKVASLVKEGFIRRVTEVRREAKGKVKVFLEMEREPFPDERLSPSALKVVSFVREKGRVERSVLLEETGVTGGVVERLEGRGILRKVLAEEVVLGGEGSIREEEKEISLTPHQERALRRVTEAMERGEGGVFLLHGVTGSGKTEVYLRAVEKALSRGYSACILIPEIALTPLTLGRFQRMFGDEVGVFHSRLTAAERKTLWERARKGKTRVLLGPRSALFVPLRKTGIIVVDEEHDQAYKQEDGVRYNARDLAILKGNILSIPVLLGSATPSAESYFRARTGSYVYLSLPERVAESRLPSIEVVDLSNPVERKGPGRYLSRKLVEAMEEAFSRGEKVMLFINRRGYAPWVMCLDCGHVERCEECSVSLTLHREAGGLLCHYCGHMREEPAACPRCGGVKIAAPGLGTERLEAFVSSRWKDRRVARMDSDAVRRKGAYGEILRRMQEGEIDVLVGTQMIAKGHDFPRVTLVGVVLADLSLSFPDFRSAERTFQVLTQVAGRAGRRERPGKVIIQTFHPDHYAITTAARHDYEGFMEMELSIRAELGYPPFTRLLLIRCTGLKEEAVNSRAKEVAELLLERFEERSEVRVLGPSPAPVKRIKRNYIYQILVKAPPDFDFAPLMGEISAEFRGRGRSGGVRIEFDVDPYQLLY